MSSTQQINHDLERLLQQNSAWLKKRGFLVAAYPNLFDGEDGEHIFDIGSDSLAGTTEDILDLDMLPAFKTPLWTTTTSDILFEDGLLKRPMPQNWALDHPARTTTPRKRRRSQGEASMVSVGSSNDTSALSLSHQDGWAEKFQELLHFKEKNGHCRVPHSSGEEENASLARWVKRQRHQHKLKMQGKASTITDERIGLLEASGCVWDSHHEAFQIRLKELAEFKALHGHTAVPAKYTANIQLATWCKCQRRQYRLFQEGQPSNLSPERIHDLERLGFEWKSNPRRVLL
jgi:hypothetical protein